MFDVFVFGSNLSGRHGKGAAKVALQHYGAQYGNGFGLQGKSYAIPTKDERLQTLPLDRIENYIRNFIEDAKLHPELRFGITHIGCGLAGYNWERDILPLFPEVLPSNCIYLKEVD